MCGMPGAGGGGGGHMVLPHHAVKPQPELYNPVRIVGNAEQILTLN
jgi:hypothetical protein